MAHIYSGADTVIDPPRFRGPILGLSNAFVDPFTILRTFAYGAATQWAVVGSSLPFRWDDVELLCSVAFYRPCHCIKNRRAMGLQSMKARGVFVLGPAWHSCGSHQLYKAQLRALRELGLKTYFLAATPEPNIFEGGDGWWDHYVRMSSDIRCDERGEAILPRTRRWRPWESLSIKRRNYMYWKSLTAQHVCIPRSAIKFAQEYDIALILCNHYFILPLASRIKKLGGNPLIALETQDLQSRHFIKLYPKHPVTKVSGTYEEYLKEEMRLSKSADVLIHLNEDEYSVFFKSLPSRQHLLIYPSIPNPIPLEVAGTDVRPDVDFLIVASANQPNYESVCWFLDNVWNHELDQKATIRIVGNIDYMFQSPGDERYKKYGKIFAGRVDELGLWYRRARCVIVPVVSGEGISIKAIEALASGKPIIYTPLAFRGFQNQPGVSEISGRVLDAVEMRASIEAVIRNKSEPARQAQTEGMNVYHRLFAPERYRRELGSLLKVGRR